MKKIIFLSFLSFFLSTASGDARASGRFFLEGDGRLSLKNSKTGMGGNVLYRAVDGSYSPQALQQLDRIFGVPNGSPEGISLRLISLLDHLQDRLKGGTIRITSGYRSPAYNEGLRKKGRLAARTSLHIEGMAADIDMDGVGGKILWEFVRGLDCCGAGYYHGKGIHVDTGPSRFWDETSTGVEKDLGGRNKLVLARTDFDVYRPGDGVKIGLGRITDYPVGVRVQATFLDGGKSGEKITLVLPKTKIAPFSKDACVLLPDRSAAHDLFWMIPDDFKRSEKGSIRIDFCEKPFEEMPDSTLSNPISVKSKGDS